MLQSYCRKLDEQFSERGAISKEISLGKWSPGRNKSKKIGENRMKSRAEAQKNRQVARTYVYFQRRECRDDWIKRKPPPKGFVRFSASEVTGQAATMTHSASTLACARASCCGFYEKETWSRVFSNA